MINKTLVEKRLSFILEAFSQLNMLANIPLDEFLPDARTVAAAESFLRRSLEATFDIGRHLLAKTGHTDLAKEYKAIAHGIGKIGAVPDSFVSTLERMAGYRNRLVHFYHEVTPEELHAIVTSHREDLRLFTRYIRDYLKQLDVEPREDA